jgi:hypothetical protein
MSDRGAYAQTSIAEDEVAGRGTKGLPNLIIIGAPKCGTTSLHFYLDLHPEVSMSEQKELHYFSRSNWRERQGWYEEQFEGCETPVRGEATPAYAFYPRKRGIPERIHSLIPEAKLIYVVRDPFEQIVSHWVQLYATGDRKPFGEYLREPGWEENRLVCASRYATQLEQYLEHFPATQLLVVDHSDLKANRRDTLSEVFRFLDVDEGFDSLQFDQERNTRTEQYALTRVGLPLWNRVLGPVVRRLPPRAHEAIGKRTIKLLSRKISSTPEIEPSLRPQIETLFKEEVDRLRALTGKRFESWLV